METPPPEPGKGGSDEEQLVEGEEAALLSLLPPVPRDRLLRQGSGRRSKTKSGANKGRYAAFTSHPTPRQHDLALDATLRVAAPYQSRRDHTGCAVALALRQRAAEGDRPVVGLILHQSQIVNGNTRHIDAVLEGLEKENAVALPLFTRIAGGEDDRRGVRRAMERYFMVGDRRLPDVILVMTGFSLTHMSWPGDGLREMGESIFAGWDVPAIQVMTTHLTRKDYLFNEETRQWMEQVNRWSVHSVSERLLEAHQRGMWNTDEETLRRLRGIYMQAEGTIEEAGV